MGSSKSTQQQQTQSHTESKSDVQQAERSYKQNFTDPEMKKAYNNFLGASDDYYGGISDLTKNLSSIYQSGGTLRDKSYFDQGWGLSTGLDNGTINYMNTRDLNPYNDEVTRNYIDASNKAAYLANGKNYDQGLQNGIGSGMPNSSQHQTAMAKVGAQLAANINAQNQATYLQRQNQLEENALKANNQLGNFYNTLSNIGLDYAKLSDQDLNTLLSAYSQQNDALRTWGQAVEMGSDPTVTTEGRQVGEAVSDQNSNSTTTTTSSGGFGSILGTVLGVMPWGNIFGGSSK